MHHEEPANINDIDNGKCAARVKYKGPGHTFVKRINLTVNKLLDA